MNKKIIYVLGIVNVFAALLPLLAAIYLYSVNILVSSMLGLLIWVTLTGWFSKYMNVKKFIFLAPIAAGPFLFLAYLIVGTYLSYGMALSAQHKAADIRLVQSLKSLPKDPRKWEKPASNPFYARLYKEGSEVAFQYKLWKNRYSE